MSTSRDDLPGARQCPACSADSGEPVLAGPDGRCTSCGQPLVINADHVEKDLGQVVGVQRPRPAPSPERGRIPTLRSCRPPPGRWRSRSSPTGFPRRRGRTRRRCRAVRTGMGLLAEGVQRGDDPAEASLTAVNAAARALAELAGADGALAVTYVSAVVSQDLMTICWLGDSRAYWLAADGLARSGPNDTIDITGGSRRITRDDSLAEEMVAAGLGVDGRRDGVTTGPRDHPLARGRPARPAGAHRAVHSDRGRACCWSPPTASGTTARRPPSWPPWRCPPHSSARSTPPPTSSSSPLTRAASTTSRLF